MRCHLFLAALCTLSQAAKTPIALRQARLDVVSRSPTQNEIQMDLGAQLSQGSVIFFPGDPEFEDATSRWNVYGRPNVSVVVEPATSNDAATIVRYANHIQRPFIAINGGHGCSKTLATIQDGIQIWLHKLKRLDVADDGQTAQLGGGLIVQDVIVGLDSIGKAAASGSCACVGVMGAGLGGGHGRLQGLFGLIADNILSADLVLWNGTQITANDQSHSDLFWGIRGAGQNFGIVTGLTYRIYDRPAEIWTHANLLFNSSVIDQPVAVIDEQNKDGIPPQMTERFFLYLWAPEVDPEHPVVSLVFNYIGPANEAAPYLKPFLDLDPLNTTTVEAPYPDIPNLSGVGLESPICHHGMQNMQFSSQLRTLEPDAARKVYGIFEELTTALPATKTASSVTFSVWAAHAVKARPDDFNAYPHRRNNFMVEFVPTYERGAASDEAVIAYGERARNTMFESQTDGVPRGTYMNYAFGNEPLESLYGEAWRVEKLRELKRLFDPENKFGAFNPIH